MPTFSSLQSSAATSSLIFAPTTAATVVINTGIGVDGSVAPALSPCGSARGRQRQIVEHTDCAGCRSKEHHLANLVHVGHSLHAYFQFCRVDFEADFLAGFHPVEEGLGRQRPHWFIDVGAA
jgi:hypothetical protein